MRLTREGIVIERTPKMVEDLLVHETLTYYWPWRWRSVRVSNPHPVGSYLNPTSDSIQAEVAVEAALRDQMTEEQRDK
jgi:hypothetical protein